MTRNEISKRQRQAALCWYHSKQFDDTLGQDGERKNKSKYFGILFCRLYSRLVFQNVRENLKFKQRQNTLVFLSAITFIPLSFILIDFKLIDFREFQIEESEREKSDFLRRFIPVDPHRTDPEMNDMRRKCICKFTGQIIFP